jgi:4-amino-4-deoxy-L-arabinose transferase-like glycosyltransferase
MPSLRAALPWVAVAILALAVRVAWLQVGAHVIEDEGTNYARVGENIAAGRGYLGLDEFGPQLIYPPLYPALIASGVELGLSSELAGRTVSLVAGVLATLLFALLAQRMYGRAAGRWCGLLAALHPLLIGASVVVLAEMTYLALLLLGLLLIRSPLATMPRGYAVSSGLVFGLAYLCRPEALLVFAAIVAVSTVLDWRRWRSVATSAALMAVAFLVVAVPYVAWLHAQTGQWRYEAKTPQGVIFQAGIAAGKLPGELYWGIDEELRGTGISMTSDVAQAHAAEAYRDERLGLAARQAKSNAPMLLRGIGALQFGGPALFVLAGLGLFAAAWSRPRARDETALLIVAGLTCVAFLVWPFVLSRSLFMLVAPLLLWAGFGASFLVAWTQASASTIGLGRRTGAVLSLAAPAAILAPLLVTALMGVRESDEMSQGWLNPRIDIRLGQLLAESTPRPRIADTAPTIAYYAGGVIVRYPWTDDDETARAYLASKSVDFIVLREEALRARPYLREWHERAQAGWLELVASASGTGGTTSIYRWRGADAK